MKGQPNKGPRRLVQSRIPPTLSARVDRYADEQQLTINDAVGDLIAIALGEPLPSQTLPRPKNPKARRSQREELGLGLTA